LPPAASCANHPERVASARCPTCVRPVCSECTIKIEGINVCTDCLRARAKAESRRGLGGGPVAAAAAVAAGFLGLSGVLFLYGLLLATVL
jgi:hypothetical protein